MSHSQIPVELESLLAHTGWLRRLARGLLGDEAAAADAVQATLLTAVQRPPATLQNPRAWFGAVLLNTIRGAARKRRAADRALRSATEPPSLPTPEDVVSGLEMQKRVASLVLRLDPPVAQVLYLRFFEDLESAEIGRRLEMPAGTVRWRIKQGLDQLRALLDAEDRRSGGKPGTWRSAIVAMLPPGPRAASATSGRLLPWLFLGAAGIGCLVAGVWVLSPAHGNRGRSDVSPRAGGSPGPALGVRVARARGAVVPTFRSDLEQASPRSEQAPLPDARSRIQALPGKALAARRSAPFSALSWKDGRPWVRVGSDVVELLSVDGHSIDEIAAYVSKSHPAPPDVWRKRLGEELVEDLTAMGHPPGERVQLEIKRDDGTKALVDAAMAIENRDAIKASRKAATPRLAPTFDPYAKVSPFTSVVFDGDKLLVQVAGTWYRLVAIEGVTAERWMAVAREKFGPQWQKRIAEDPVEALTPALGTSPSEAVDLDLAEPETGQLVRLDQVAMTEENRREVKRTWR